MKIPILFFIILSVSLLQAQEFSLTIKGKNDIENRIIDSISYLKKHSSVAEMLKTQQNFEKKLFQNGYYSFRLLEQKKITDSTFVFHYTLGIPIKQINITTQKIPIEEKEELNITEEIISIPPSEIENWLEQKSQLLEKKGYPLAKIQLNNHKISNQTLTASLVVSMEIKRKINDFVILGYENFPANIKKNWLKKYKKQNFNSESLKAIQTDIETFSFATETRTPEILFTPDTTAIFLYLQKTKPSKFDGFIGFATDNETDKLVFNGYLDLNLINVLNGGESFNLYWRNDGNSQTSFNLSTEIPYLFKSPIGTKASLKIFKQDSVFQNTQFNVDLGYLIDYRKKIYIGYQSTVSTDIQNQNTLSLNNFNSKFFTLSLDFSSPNTILLSPNRYAINTKIGLGNRNILNQKTSQYFTEIEAYYNFTLNSKNNIFIKNQTFFLNSDTYLINELYRFGGINSIRGFRENSLQANFFAGLMAEYQYYLSPSLYVHTITDYGHFQDKTANLSEKLIGLGFGFGMQTKTGLFKFVYANGSTSQQSFDLKNSIVQLSFSTKF